MSSGMLSIILIIIVAVLFISNRLPIAVISLGAAIVCGLLGFIEYKDVFSSLAGTSAILLMSMMIVGGAVFHTGLARKVCKKMMGVTGTSLRGIILAIMIVSAALSAICSNVGVVAVMMPIVYGICKESKISPSKLLYPLALGAGLGGSITLVGTSSAASASSMLEAATGATFGFLDFAWTGIPLTIVGILYMYFIGYKLLPDYEADWSELVIEEEGDVKQSKMIICGIVIAAVVVFMIWNPKKLPLYMFSSIGALILVVTGCVTEKQAYKSIDWTTIAICGGMTALSNGVIGAGGGELIANAVADVLGGSANPLLITAVIFIIVSVMTQFLSNNGTVSLMTPIAIFVASGLGLNVQTMAMIVAVAANSSFATPVGAQAFTMVAEPGKYTFMDFVKLGLPVVFTTMICCLIILPLVWSF